MKRSGPLKRSSSLKRTSRLAPVSKKRQRENNQRRAVIKKVLEHRKACEAGRLIGTVDNKHRCSGQPDDIHEPLTRARGGSIVDPANMVVVCRLCHDWIHVNPRLATSVGLLVSAYK